MNNEVYKEIQGKNSSSDQTVIRAVSPFNSEPKSHLLTDFITSTEIFYVRNHGSIPEIKEQDYKLFVSIDLDIQGQRLVKDVTYTLKDLQTQFTKTKITATLTGGGLRREEFNKYKKISQEPPKKRSKNGDIEFGIGACGNAVWGGVRLKDLLFKLGTDQFFTKNDDIQAYVAFEGADQIEILDKKINFGCSIPLSKALQPECLLAYEMNDKPLLPAHGFPLRTIIPGYIGGRSVKWLKKISVQMHPSDNYFQQMDFKLFAPQRGPNESNIQKGITLGEYPVNSVICIPKDGEIVNAGNELTVKGFAITGGNRTVERVDVTIDNGCNWIEADIVEDTKNKFSWRLWSTKIIVPKASAGKKLKICTRAIDSSANSQPSEIGHIWNWMRYVNNAWHSITLNVQQ